MIYTMQFIIIAIYLILHIRLGKHIENVLTELGKYSMPMWFIHGYFTLYLFHDYLCMLKYPLFIYIALVIVSYVISVPIVYVSSILQKRVLRI